jgi:copper(I)-binding protein
MPGTAAAAAAARRAARVGAAGRITRAAAAAGLALLTAAGLAGCYTRASAGTSIALSTAYVPLPTSGETVAYLVIQNNGGADRLLSARTSVGGRVAIRAPERPGGTVMHTIRSVAIPGHSLVRLVPDGLHLMITDAGPMHGGKDVTLILRFAHAGPVSVLAQVTNPQTGGSSYFLN